MKIENTPIEVIEKIRLSTPFWEFRNLHQSNYGQLPLHLLLSTPFWEFQVIEINKSAYRLVRSAFYSLLGVSIFLFRCKMIQILVDLSTPFWEFQLHKTRRHCEVVE